MEVIEMSSILLVEDDLSLIYGLEYYIQKNGFSVDVARTVEEALQIYKEKNYDLLLLDVSLPDGDGFDICKRVREASNVPIIFLTASDEEVNIIRGLDCGLLMKNKNIVLTRKNILDKLWDGNGSFVDDNTLSVYVRRLRNKIEDNPENPKILLTVRRMGYKWNVIK